MEQGWDPEVKRYFRKIIYSFSYGLMWMMSCVTAGLYFGLAYRKDIPLFYNILFYAGLLLTLILLLRYYYRVWKK
ncbi:MAG TPA: hypothetical protein VI461_15700 [Chitinophagaceae bacterium]|nr:hypothetical protein [Chitinophagaceae bacterium]